ncbi:hypothetical protein J32TS6_20870 [Virgibacillus pantothenticus]|uniref:hypothetical protein n=1 Tax=Virgibacillus pantothenticus TaxID=1473 RepID=UPI001B074BF2|nr:hypothetical protein [Virgibacillus pantothenticus]GIP63532.1 hypothetical protein J32TS6_20870 [Virgibacillus pantothenticus]
MKSYLRLTEFELGRFFKFYFVLIGLTIVTQLIGVVAVSKQYMNEANEAIFQEGMSKQDFIEQSEPISLLDWANSIWFLGPIAFCIATLLIYMFLIWYRDWLGENTFIYRLLMLPTQRINLFFAKATAIFAMVLGLVALQVLLIFIAGIVLEWMVPNEFMSAMSVTDLSINFPYLHTILPATFTEFVLYYSTGLMAVFVFFTAILIERSYRWKGLIFAIGYVALATVFFMSPFIVSMIPEEVSLYPLEWLTVQIILGLIVMVGSVVVSNYLLAKKITV